MAIKTKEGGADLVFAPWRLKGTPTVLAYSVAVGKTAIALALILDVFTNSAVVAGSVLSILIWSTAEGFDGPYKSGSTDIGTAG